MHILRGVEKAISNVIPHQHSADKRAASALTKQQMDYYQSAKDEMHKQNEDIAAQKTTEANKIHEKQIRSMRNTFRNPGFLGSGSDLDETSSKLG